MRKKLRTALPWLLVAAALALTLIPAFALAAEPALIPPPEKAPPPVSASAPVELGAGQTFKVPSRPEVFVVQPDGMVRLATPNEIAAPVMTEQAKQKTGRLTLLVVLISVISTWVVRKPDVVREWLGDRPTLARFLPILCSALSTACVGYLGDASTADLELMLGLGGVSAIGAHQVADGAKRSVTNLIDKKAAIKSGSQPPGGVNPEPAAAPAPQTPPSA